MAATRASKYFWSLNSGTTRFIITIVDSHIIKSIAIMHKYAVAAGKSHQNSPMIIGIVSKYNEPLRKLKAFIFPEA